MPKNPKISEFIDFVPVNIKLAGWIPERVKSGFFAKNPSRWGGLIPGQGVLRKRTNKKDAHSRNGKTQSLKINSTAEIQNATSCDAYLTRHRIWAGFIMLDSCKTVLFARPEE
jgi:hypothetical protein